MPEQQAANIQILGQLQAQLQLESEAISRAEQQRTYIQAMLAEGTPPVVELDSYEQKPVSGPDRAEPTKAVSAAKARLEAMLARYTEDHPDVQKLKQQIAEEEAAAKAARPAAVVQAEGPPVAQMERRRLTQTPRTANPVLLTQLTALEAEISKHKEEQHRLSRQVATYRGKLEAVPMREQQMTQLVRDYEMSKAHYSQLREKQLSAETATQLEIRQKGEKFTILDPAQVPEKPASPNRPLINIGGCLGGLLFGLMLAVAMEFVSASITEPIQVGAVTGFPVLEVIPVIQTHVAIRRHRRRLILAALSGFCVILAGGALVLYRYGQGFF
jgi:uncharacterized protein involved in exopolysaccharide biosynthesis